MSDLKQVKVDNWGIYFLQRLKHFFNRTDYCDLTLQFQDNAQLKVHRLVLNACTEYFELLERTCEMYEDCLVMPDDLQADVVVPIVNFMYTGQLEFKVNLLDKLYQTSQIMNMPVLTKLLDVQRQQVQFQTQTTKPTNTYSAKRYSKPLEQVKQAKSINAVPSLSSNLTSNKRSYSKAFEADLEKEKQYISAKKTFITNNVSKKLSLSPTSTSYNQKLQRNILTEPRPTRYELPEELDADNIFDSFTSISYDSKPLMVHPEAVKNYQKKKNMLNDPSTSKSFKSMGTSTLDIVECKRVSRPEILFEDDPSMSVNDESEFFRTPGINVKEEGRDTDQLFDQILDENDSPKVTIETKGNKQPSNIDHAKIISEVLKKYPHLVKSNKNIKLKILNTPSKPKKKFFSSPQNMNLEEKETVKPKADVPDFTYETDVMDSKEAARLIAMGAENIKGPWICLICGTPGKALYFTSYFKFRRHLVEVHYEKPVTTLCEYCGLKSGKRNYLLHHMYTKHGVEPPPQYNFPKCNICNYVALTEAFLVKHKITHSEPRNFRCNICSAAFSNANKLLVHIKNTGHRYSARDKKNNQQCVYCLKTFLRESNLYAHLKTNHKQVAKNDCIIDDSEDEKQEEEEKRSIRYRHREKDSEDSKLELIKYEVPISFHNEYDEIEGQYQLHERPDGNLQLVTKKQHSITSTPKQKILNAGFSKPTGNLRTQSTSPKVKVNRKVSNLHNDYLQDDIVIPNTSCNEEIVMIGDCEYVVRDNQLILRRGKSPINEEYILSDVLADSNSTLQPISTDTSIDLQTTTTQEVVQTPKMSFKKSHPIQFVVSNDEEYKALMSSNHSIIFDDEDTNKTLTVLTAPHNAITNNVDLNNSQSNDMMIIQDHYPLNVSEAVSENSNIVVVYSHPVEDQNKQYQVLTTQAVDSQFVESSTVIAQNYETVSTSTPVLSAQVIGAHTEETWQGNTVENMESKEMQINSETEYQEDTIVEQTVILQTDIESNKNMEELPEVQLPSDPKSSETEVNHTNESEETHDIVNNEIIVNENTDDTNVDETQNMSTSPKTIEAQSEVTETQISTVLTNEGEEIIDSNQQNISDDNLISKSPIATIENAVPETVIQINPKKPTELNNKEIDKNTINAIEPIITENTTEKCDNEEKLMDKAVNHDVSPCTKSKDQIENLALEWSEDEDEVHKQDDNTTDIPKDIKLEEAESSFETEESIENIQQEMAKQMSEIKQGNMKIDSNVMSSQDNLTTQPDLKQTEPTADSQEKLSSILNDWEENDSQEEVIPENRNTIDSLAPTQPVDINIIAEELNENNDKVKNDDIKNLVSDWDDEEEENKVSV